MNEDLKKQKERRKGKKERRKGKREGGRRKGGREGGKRERASKKEKEYFRITTHHRFRLYRTPSIVAGCER